MQLIDVRVLPVSLPLKAPFLSAHENLSERTLTLIQLTTDTGLKALGELEAFEEPGYNAETQLFERQVMIQELIPALKVNPTIESLDPAVLWPQVSGHRMAKAALEMPLWALKAQETGVSLAEFLAQEVGDSLQETLRVGISLGMGRLDTLRKRVAAAMSAGYQRVKIKVASSFDLSKIEAIRSAFPQLQLMVDGNAAFRLADITALKQLESLDILMLEQPLRSGDFEGHSQLQRQLRVAICLDEDILTINDLLLAQRLKSAQAINLKPARVGGFTECLKMLQLCRKVGLACWVGGMVESDVGRYYSQSLASLSTFSIPGDVGPTAQFYTDALSDWQPTFEAGELRMAKKIPQLTDRFARLMAAQPNLLR